MAKLIWKIKRQDGVEYTYEGTLESLIQHLEAQPVPATYEAVQD